MDINQIKKLITPVLKRNAIERAGLFGSVATGADTADSDVDILVQLRQEMSLLDFVRLKLELEDALRVPVDLVEYKAIKLALRDRILAEEIRIYGQEVLVNDYQ